MKKIKRAVLILLFVSTVMMAAFTGWDLAVRDRRAPEIRLPETALQGTVRTTQEELLAGVTAEDDRDGAVEVFVEQISPINPEREQTVTYAAADRAGNVSRATRTLVVSDYHRPRFELRQALRIPTGASVYAVLEAATVTDARGTDLTPRIKCSILDDKSWSEAGTHLIELRVTDSFGFCEVLELELEVYSASEEKIGVRLTDYLIYLPKNARFDPMEYFLESTLPGEVTVHSEVNPSVPGIYYVDYTVQGEAEDSRGGSRLTVIVEE